MAGLFGDRMNFKRAGPCHFFEHEQEEVEWPYGSRRTGQIFEQTLGKRSTLLWLVNAAKRFKETPFEPLALRFEISHFLHSRELFEREADARFISTEDILNNDQNY